MILTLVKNQYQLELTAAEHFCLGWFASNADKLSSRLPHPSECSKVKYLRYE